jgi:hypothetical protein
MRTFVWSFENQIGPDAAASVNTGRHIDTAPCLRELRDIHVTKR